MAKRDINLFKAAGGERAKGAKASPVAIMAFVTLIVSAIAIGVGVYYNMKANTAVNDYEKKVSLKSSYATTKAYVRKTSEQYKSVVSDIQSAKAINDYIESESHLYPKATDGEVAAIKETILNNTIGNSYSMNDPVEGERFTPWDYGKIAEAFYQEELPEGAEGAEYRQLFYYAMKALETAQKADQSTNVWYTYYRGYMVMMFSGGNSAIGLDALAESFNENTESMNGLAPFTELEMDGYYYSPVKYTYVLYNDTTYNLLMCPLKSVIERALDILEAHAEALVDQEGYSFDQEEFASYAIKNIAYTREELDFTLLLPDGVSFADYCRDFSASVFFEVDNDVTESGERDGENVAYSVKLLYKGVERKGGDEQ